MNIAKRPVQKIDFSPYGAAIKSARKGRKESRNQVGDEVYLSPRYLANIENKGQHPSLQIFFELMSRYHISVDQFLFGDTAVGKSTARRQLDATAKASLTAAKKHRTDTKNLQTKVSQRDAQPHNSCAIKGAWGCFPNKQNGRFRLCQDRPFSACVYHYALLASYARSNRF